eukprot:9152137-Pyramimonas_sp.AAC.1
MAGERGWETAQIGDQILRAEIQRRAAARAHAENDRVAMAPMGQAEERRQAVASGQGRRCERQQSP